MSKFVYLIIQFLLGTIQYAQFSNEIWYAIVIRVVLVIVAAISNSSISQGRHHHQNNYHYYQSFRQHILILKIEEKEEYFPSILKR